MFFHTHATRSGSTAQVFGGKYSPEIFGDAKPRWHYDNFLVAFGTTFQIMTFDNWNLVMYDAVRATGDAAIVYYVAWIITGAYVLLNLLLVIILDVYVDQASVIKRAAGFEENNIDPMNESMDAKNSRSIAAAEADDEKEDKSLGIFGLDSELRKKCTYIATSPALDSFIMVVILTNCGTMALETPNLDPEGALSATLVIVRHACSVVASFTRALGCRHGAKGWLPLSQFML
eukprot:SAG31_NODE_5605_length_2426_cov_1.841856_3_plen_232_part_00